jgi:hypothetical protein
MIQQEKMLLLTVKPMVKLSHFLTSGKPFVEMSLKMSTVHFSAFLVLLAPAVTLTYSMYMQPSDMGIE